jgi:hypothetical protein
MTTGGHSSSGANIVRQQEADAAPPDWLTAANVAGSAVSMALAHLHTVDSQTWCRLLSLAAALLHLGNAVASSQILKRSSLTADSSIHQYHISC